MLNKKERMEKLNNAGINTGKYFSVDLPNGLKPGAKISLVINENGEPMVVGDNYDENTVMSGDYIANQIITDGYVRNTKLHRRFVMAQMFEMLNYMSYDKKEIGYHGCLRRRYSYDYTLNMMLDEVKVLSKLEVKDRESFEERSSFFTKEVIVSVLEDYIEKLVQHVESRPNHNCKGVPYKKIKGKNIFNDDLNKKVYSPLKNYVYYVKVARNYTEIYRYLKRFMKDMIKLPYDTPKSKVWIDAFKGEGAYYTLKNLIMFHNCRFFLDDGYPYYGEGDIIGKMNHLKSKLNEYKGEGWRMFALMNKVIKDNNFDFKKRMQEIYSK